MKTAEQDVTHQPATSFPISFQHQFKRAGGRTFNVLQEKSDLDAVSFGDTMSA
jgi:hypothetical protein